MYANNPRDLKDAMCSLTNYEGKKRNFKESLNAPAQNAK